MNSRDSVSYGSVRPRRSLAGVVSSVLGEDLPVAVEMWDGSRLGPEDAPATIEVRSPDALSRIITAPGELGFARAYVAGDIEVRGDIFAVLALRDRLPRPHLDPRQWIDAVRLIGPRNLKRLPAPPEEAHPRGRLHSKQRDAADISHHYDVSNAFYELVLGPAMTYSCALFVDNTDDLAAAQWAKHELVCEKLGLRPGMRLLDVGCGWGTLAMHAARHHGAEVLGVTLSSEQARWARRRVVEEGLGDQVEIRLQDYRDISDGPFDSISSVGMFEHVGAQRLGQYFGHLHSLLAPAGRLLNHAISRPPGGRPGLNPRSFVGRYVFPDGALIEVGDVISGMQSAGFEARHMESLREHYARTLRIWVSNLEANWDRAVQEVGAPRARIWRLYMAGSAIGFESGRIGINQVLACRTDRGRSAMALRPEWNPAPHMREEQLDPHGAGRGSSGERSQDTGSGSPGSATSIDSGGVSPEE